MNFIGELAGLATSVFFAATAVVFTQTGKMVGSKVTNVTRATLALLYLLIINTIFFGSPLPFSAAPERWMWLTVSGLVGLAIGDAFLFQALVCVGPRISTLLMSLAPVIGALTAWVIFGETLTAGQMAGIAVTLAGIAWVVVTTRHDDGNQACAPGRGVLFGILAAIGQAWGLVLSKQGMLGDFSPFEGGAIRMLAAVIMLWVWAAIEGRAASTIRTLRETPKALRLLALGAFVGPLLGVSASLLAVQHAPIGVASTLMALPPVIMLPISYFYFKERFGWQAVAGTLVAIAGVAMLFLV